jgi:cyclopropane fatty-acyl-phospholipid synthase-like methyltransferase
VNLPFAEASEQNKSVIFEVIKPYLHGEVLEIGSGTGQHAVFFAGQVPQVRWQTSDLEPNLPGIEAWIADSGLPNLPAPLALDVMGDWPERQFDMVYSANCFHIMDKTAVEKCIEGVGACLKPGGVLAVYGPFNYAGNFTSPSNARFDAFLKARDPASGIKDFEWLDELADKESLQLVDDVAMPANNRSLVWQKRTL